MRSETTSRWCLLFADMSLYICSGGSVDGGGAGTGMVDGVSEDVAACLMSDQDTNGQPGLARVHYARHVRFA